MIIKLFSKPKKKKKIKFFQKNQKASDIIKQSLNENKINKNIEDDNNNENEFGGYDRLLISDDEDDEDKKDENKEQKPLANAFIDTKKISI